MTAAARQTVVGLFVLVGLGLALGAVLAFGRLHLLSPLDRAVIFFPGNVAGLAPGAPVLFRGLRVGSVETVSLQVDPDTLHVRIPVILQLDPQPLQVAPGASGRDGLRRLVAAGLRGELSLQSFVTGQMVVELDISPNSGAIFSGAAFSGGVLSGNRNPLPGDLVEIPSAQSPFERLRDQVTHLPLRDLAGDTQRTLHTVEHLADTLDRSLPPLIASLQVTADGLHDAGPIIKQSVETIRTEALRVIGHYDALSASLRTAVAARGPEVKQLLATANQAADHARHLVATLDALTSDRSEDRLNLEASLRDLAAAAGSLRGIARDVEADPTLVLRGRAR